MTSLTYEDYPEIAFTFLRFYRVLAVSCALGLKRLELPKYAPTCTKGKSAVVSSSIASQGRHFKLMANAQSQPALSPDGSPQSAPSLRTETMQLELLQFPPGEGQVHSQNAHTLFVNLTTRPIDYLQTQDGKTHTGLYRRGDFTLTPADLRFFARWQGTENCLKIQLGDRFLRSVAQETLTGNRDRLSLIPTFQGRNGQIEAIATLLLAELQQNQSGGALYLDSLANVLAVQLLRNYSSTLVQLPNYEGGLPPHHLRQVLEYVDAYLTEDIKLADLAQLLSMSPFHFSRLFKQSMGISPHQYLIQQRVERAKRLLKQGDRAIVEIALECGFNSHSHLSKQFRQVTGMTPNAFRKS
jgi:AraC family transcriptional regulator